MKDRMNIKYTAIVVETVYGLVIILRTGLQKTAQTESISVQCSMLDKKWNEYTEIDLLLAAFSTTKRLTCESN